MIESTLPLASAATSVVITPEAVQVDTLHLQQLAFTNGIDLYSQRAYLSDEYFQQDGDAGQFHGRHSVSATRLQAHKVYDFDSAAKHVMGIYAPSLSPDGKSVAFVALNQVYIMPFGGTPKLRMPN